MRSWLRAKPWRIWPLSRRGWRYHAIYRTARQGSWSPSRGRWIKGAEPVGRLRALWVAVAFPHVHDDEYEARRG
jgi:hypothetical protein